MGIGRSDVRADLQRTQNELSACRLQVQQLQIRLQAEMARADATEQELKKVQKQAAVARRQLETSPPEVFAFKRVMEEWDDIMVKTAKENRLVWFQSRKATDEIIDYLHCPLVRENVRKSDGMRFADALRPKVKHNHVHTCVRNHRLPCQYYIIKHMVPSVENTVNSIQSLCKNLNNLGTRLNNDRFSLLSELAQGFDMELVPKYEYNDLIARAKKIQDDIKSEIDSGVATKVETLNMELKHRVEMEKLLHQSELETLRAKIEILSVNANKAVENTMNETILT